MHQVHWKIQTTSEEDVYGIPVNLCTRMSQHAKEDCVLFEENAYVAIENWLYDDKNIRYVKVKNKGKDIKLNDFGVTPIEKSL